MKIPFGDNFLDLNLNKETKIFKLKEIEGNKIFNSHSFENFIKNVNNLLIIVNDHARITPTNFILSKIEKYIKKIDKVKFVIATGTHRKTTVEELKIIFGDYYSSYKENIIIHDALKGDFDYYGKTNFGTEVYYNSILKQFDNLLLIGGVEPHYFAGFSGGRKSIFPGIASYKSIEQNHKLALENNSRILALADNPVNIDICEAVSFVKKNIYSIQLVNNEKGKIKFISQGTLTSSFKEAVNFALEYFTILVPNKVDLLISIVEPPFDKNFYQAHKGLENTKSFLSENGTMVLIAKCEQGIGNDNFYRLLKLSSKIDNISEYIYKNYRLGYHKTSKIINFINSHNLILISDLKQELFKGIKIKVSKELQKIYDELIKESKSSAIVFNAGVAVPVIGKEEKNNFGI